MYFYQVMTTFHYLNDVANDTNDEAYDEKDEIWPRVNFVTIFGELYQIKR